MERLDKGATVLCVRLRLYVCTYSAKCYSHYDASIFNDCHRFRSKTGERHSVSNSSCVALFIYILTSVLTLWLGEVN